MTSRAHITWPGCERCDRSHFGSSHLGLVLLAPLGSMCFLADGVAVLPCIGSFRHHVHEASFRQWEQVWPRHSIWLQFCGQARLRVESRMARGSAIGIDLGTNYSCVGFWKYDGVEIIANDQGNRTTSSYAPFTDTERLFGDAAKNQVAQNPENTVFDAKRLIGQESADPIVQVDIKLWPFKVMSGQGDKPMIEVDCQGRAKKFHPEEVSSMILPKLKETAETKLSSKFNDAVVTVPAYVNNSQRQAP